MSGLDKTVAKTSRSKTIALPPSGQNVLPAVQEIRAGMTVNAFADLAERVGVSKDLLAKAVGLSPRTLRHQTQRLAPVETDRLQRVARVFAEAVDTLADEAAARRWMVRPAYGLGGATPLSYLDTEPGTQEVVNLLGAVKYGNYF